MRRSKWWSTSQGVFALVEQYLGAMVPDVLALETRALPERGWVGDQSGVAVAIDPPKTRFISRADEESVYAARANRVAIHRDDETIAVIDIVSPGNKSSTLGMRQFIDKSLAFLERGIHLLVIDLSHPQSEIRRGFIRPSGAS